MIATKTTLNGVTSAEEALDKTGANFIVEQQELVTTSGVEVPGHYAMVRTDTNKEIGVVGSRYKPFQNNYLFSMFDVLCESHGLQFDYGHVLDGGKKIMLRARIPGTAKIRKGDECLKYIDFLNSFDGTTPFLGIFTFYRQICSNGMWGNSKENRIVIRHTKKAEDRVQEAMKVLSTSLAYFEKFEKQCQTLAAKMMDKKMVENFLNTCVGEATTTRKKNIRERIEDLYENGLGTDKGSSWDMYNAYTEWIDHHRGSNDEKRMANSILASSDMKEKAFKTLMNI